MLASGIERTYYLCPHCGFKYTVMLTDYRIRELMQKRDKLRGYAKYKNNGVRDGKKKEYELLDMKVKEELNILNGK